MLIKISDTVMVNPHLISSLESIKTKTGYRIMVHIDGNRYESTIPFDDLMKMLKDSEEVKQFWAGK